MNSVMHGRETKRKGIVLTTTAAAKKSKPTIIPRWKSESVLIELIAKVRAIYETHGPRLRDKGESLKLTLKRFEDELEQRRKIQLEKAVHSSDSPLQPKADKELSVMSITSRENDWKRSRILIRGVYVQVELKTTFEEILTAKPNFLSGLRLKTVRMKTEAVESAIISFQILRQRTAFTISSEELAYIKDSLDDLESNGLDTAWLERGYQRANLLITKQKVSSASAEIARLEREETENGAAFEMARAKLEASTARRVAFQAEYDAIMQELEVGKELFGGHFDLKTCLGDGLLD